jgi:hypothetical protein
MKRREFITLLIVTPSSVYTAAANPDLSRVAVSYEPAKPSHGPGLEAA